MEKMASILQVIHIICIIIINESLAFTCDFFAPHAYVWI